MKTHTEFSPTHIIKVSLWRNDAHSRRSALFYGFKVERIKTVLVNVNKHEDYIYDSYETPEGETFWHCRVDLGEGQFTIAVVHEDDLYPITNKEGK